MRRIVLVIWGFETFGGMERHVCELARGLHRASMDVTVVSEMPVDRSNTYAQDLRRSGIALLHAPRLVWIANAVRLAGHFPRSDIANVVQGKGLLSRWLMRTLDRLAGQGRADLIHVHGCRLGQSWVIDWARRRGVPSMYTEHMTIAENGGPLTADGPRQALGAGVLACVSEHSARSLASLLPEPRAIEITGHVIDGQSDATPPTDEHEPLEILCPARLEPHKGVDVLLRAFALVGGGREPRARLTIVGSGRDGGRLKKLARDLNIGGATRFAGALTPALMTEAMLAAGAMVLPSRSEGLPLALLEAMACGKAVVASRAGGIPEIICDGENGLLVEPDDPPQLARALGKIMGDAKLRGRLGGAARRTFDDSRHHERRVIPEMLALYRQAARAC